MFNAKRINYEKQLLWLIDHDDERMLLQSVIDELQAPVLTRHFTKASSRFIKGNGLLDFFGH